MASCLASHLVDTLYVLDEPTIGLHPRDVERFLRVIVRLRDLGNTVLVVEHDTSVLAAADHVVELGPGSGERGGEIVFEGSWASLMSSETVTGQALRAPRAVARPRRGRALRRSAAGRRELVRRGGLLRPADALRPLREHPRDHQVMTRPTTIVALVLIVLTMFVVLTRRAADHNANSSPRTGSRAP